MEKQNIYKIQLYKYQRVKGYTEELIITDFQPAKIDGFGVRLANKQQRREAKNG
jgi:hypothetical protein